MGKPIHILMVEDSEDDAELLLYELRRGGYEPVYRRVDTAGAMTDALQTGSWDVVTADHRMPHFSSAEALALLNDRGLDVPFIIVSGTIGEESAVAAMRSGAKDYLIKGNLKRLVPAVEREIADALQRREQRESTLTLLAHQEQLRIARDIQQHLFPPGQLLADNFEIAGTSLPTEATGGDYFDYITMPDNYLGVLTGDITGHGLGASLLMSEMRACLRTLALNCTDVSEIFTRANRLTRDDFGGTRFMTILFARLCAKSQSLMYLNAGHPAGYILDSNGNVRQELKSAGLPLGLHPDSDFTPACHADLEPGDLVLLLTDGVIDALTREGDAFDASRALDLVRAHRERPAATIVEILCRTARESVPECGQQDDITAVVIKVNHRQ